MTYTIRLAYEDTDAVRELFAEYTAMLTAEDEEIDAYLTMQHYDEELLHLEEKYGLPAGRLYVAYCGETPAGCIALRKIDDTYGEVKRLYVRPAFRGTGLSHALMDRILTDARTIGYRALRLDTLPFLRRAISLYRQYGFTEIPRYNDCPVATAIYMERDLT